MIQKTSLKNRHRISKLGINKTTQVLIEIGAGRNMYLDLCKEKKRKRVYTSVSFMPVTAWILTGL